MIILGFGMLITGSIIFLILPLSISHENSFWISLFNYFCSVGPFLTFFLLFLHLWLWNTIGRTVLKYDDEKIIVIKKFNLLVATKTYYRTEIIIDIKDFKLEKTRYFTRYHLFSKSTFSLVFIQNNLILRIINWQSYEKSKEIVDLIK
ncbi:PIN domain nuclease of toxin-antitoxin system [Chryseobacterium sp. SORGH_AS 447]|uniref:hypothetical protein n=1 Tax=Chryseobacterium sp. SORGH_AS_0447 TaxID=3041769 RepID=UPI0027834F1B|nr:hypothetical protein [Chryseobacterium sp. SORGH_AS_0447]MDQ1162759.1 PIN domain nuclease of toxin-antitoxin system [Chryseobacterium sp. SORGH_AS_0447]